MDYHYQRKRNTPAVSKMKKFNFKYLKEQASAGSFRRGYECYTNGNILESRTEKNFYHAKVKGNYQDFYNTDLIFKKNTVEARCNCPLKEEWCKHSVAVAVKAIKESAYENFLLNKFDIQPDLDDENTSRVFSILQEAAHVRGKTVFLVTHEKDAEAVADRILRMDSGSLTEC